MPLFSVSKGCHSKLVYLLAYLVFGGLHEAAHWFTARFYVNVPIVDNSWAVDWLSLLRTTLGRAYVVSDLVDASDAQLSLIRHVGWVASVLIAILVSTTVRCYFTRTRACRIAKIVAQAAWATALEAIVSDLLQFGIKGLPKTTFLCGNFGLILMNEVSDATLPLNLLQKMTQITMMRGSQSGGVVAWTKKSWSDCYAGLRTRVVNGKRTDLSEKLRRAVEPKVTQPFGTQLKMGVRTFLGHTRFATSSSKTYLEGTHPHQWTPPMRLKVFRNFFTKNPEVTVTEVENFVTHNGDFDFFRLAGEYIDLESLQDLVELALGQPRPNTVDSATIAGVIDLLRTAGCFPLSIRCAVVLHSKLAKEFPEDLPAFAEYTRLSTTFENCVKWVCRHHDCTLEDAGLNYRKTLIDMVVLNIKAPLHHSSLNGFISDDGDVEEGKLTVEKLVSRTIDAFFDNDLFNTTKTFMENAKGSFGLMVTSSLEASRQICIAARGQPMSIAFYPNKGVVCYGSEQAAVKAGLGFLPFGKVREGSDETCRLDLDDHGGEVCLIDWGDHSRPMVSYPNRHLPSHSQMHGEVRLILIHESRATESNIRNRLTMLESNEYVRQLPETYKDSVLQDIQEIPRVCQTIQDDWHESGLNRISAWNLTRCLRRRLQARHDRKIPVSASTVDILLTGCEVSLWLCEQFATDLQKAFPKLFIRCVSSNKLLGVFGQELAVPAVGNPLSEAYDLNDVLVLIVSHSGGTFAPLACSNLLQSSTNNIFVVTSEWDTQIGKQLRSMETEDLCSSRIFSTEIGVRPAEPCSLSVVATHQLLTQIFEHVCLTVLGNAEFRHLSGAVISEDDLRILERCNMENIAALESIVGLSEENSDAAANESRVSDDLRRAGSVWADHVLENARAYIMSFLYIVGTVTSGYPLITGLSIAFGLDTDWAFYVTRFFDSLIYFFLPQINIIILRLLQGRNLRHRMVGRTVIIGDIPWVAQAADAFLSKLFACSYSIASLNVLHGNPTDHLVHRHTHRVVRGSLLLVGRPDGRLSGLTSAEATVCLSVNQASSIQSLGGTCESITIGHNPASLSLTDRDIFLETHRPQFFCERVLASLDVEKMRQRSYEGETESEQVIKSGSIRTRRKSMRSLWASRHKGTSLSASQHSTARISDCDADIHTTRHRTTHALLGAYVGLGKEASEKNDQSNSKMEWRVVEELIQEKSAVGDIRRIFDEIDKDGSGGIDREEFLEAFKQIDGTLSDAQINKIFDEVDENFDGELDIDEFVQVARMSKVKLIRQLNTMDRDVNGLVSVVPSDESYFGETIRKLAPTSVSSFAMSKGQHFAMELYESRVASLQRFVAICVMGHTMAKRVRDFFPRWSLGILGYQIHRTQSIMRIATTASPVSAADVRERMERLRLVKTIQNSIQAISASWLRYKERKVRRLLSEYNGRNGRLQSQGETSDENKTSKT